MDISIIFIGIFLALTVFSLVAGVVLMGVGGKYNKKFGNKLMVARVVCQTLVVVVLFLAFAASK